MKRLFGHTEGLKAHQTRRLENLYRRKIRPQLIVTQELTRDLCRLSFDIRRQIGLMIDRRGQIIHVIVGDHQRIVIPDTPDFRTLPGRLKGLRCIHTHLKNEPLSQDDITDLILLRLDIMAVVTINDDGSPLQVHTAHLLPENRKDRAIRLLSPLRPVEPDIDIGCLSLIQALEEEISRREGLKRSATGRERALLVSVTTASRKTTKASMRELKELVRSAGADIVQVVIQHRKKADARLLMGKGKLGELAVSILQKAATMVVFDQELNPSQIRSITDQIEIKVVDRTQLILDIFAQQAQTREGKLQVELAQLRYMLPRLVTKNTAMSRLTGGIGGRGPGETKLEINRRRVRERITRLEADIKKIQRQRLVQRTRRSRRNLPVISIVGYTNAGKSTLLNTLTHSRVKAENRLFATLDPSSRRLRFPEDREVIITDTVGFIQDLPKELLAAFRATLEELENADILLHVIDISNPAYPGQVASVDRILSDLHLDRIPVIRVLNKMDLVTADHLEASVRELSGVAVSAKNRPTLAPLTEQILKTIS